jgi:hypothetical protein
LLLLLVLVSRLLVSMDEAEDLFVDRPPLPLPRLELVVFITMLLLLIAGVLFLSRLSVLFKEVLLLLTYSRSAKDTGFTNKKKKRIIFLIELHFQSDFGFLEKSK